MTDCRAPGAALQRLEDWYASPLGRELAAKEAACLERMLCDTFGYYLLQVGLVDALDGVLGGCRIRHRILLPDGPALGRVCQAGRIQVVVDPCQLPIASDSIDAVVLPHVLEFAVDARQVLREAERVLIPEGRVIILGFNNLSLWGLRRQLARGQRRVPWCGNFLTPFRVVDWLSLLGFDIELQERMMFRPPWRRTLFQDLSFFEGMGQRFVPTLAGVFAIRAVKRVSTLTPLRPSWRQRRALLSGRRPVRPTARLVRRHPSRVGTPRPPGHGPSG
ncbi:methylase involved in ubiquinone/menaquinone biosynthesis [Thioflavicoccus mobilis 8321]|uniref:Methylase involved in ubiquinone/menaquinone biosynthesis n=1 Tax=Thioflavicoccus mobilis 8321 TaxID=765912 RepID=L0GYR8_9GAMM|nr:methyltransferase domain-containing protein [Thioflavicoccus mobilis]AGA91106.1 methylase involved in ubiquinone/menaquinone biosynthesis [Thioflavicoccus mobilis 8321]